MSAGNQLPNLDKIFRDDDELDFQPSAGSNLAAIFAIQAKGQDTQIPSKQQSHKKASSARSLSQIPVSNKLEVIIAKVVHAFKLENGSYRPVGNLGMALVGTVSTKTYQLILYKTKQEHVSVVTITHDFLYTVQANNYSSYYDNSKENWSILFENNEVCTEFAREIGLARYFSKPVTIETVVYQDLTPISKDVVAKEGNHIHMKYFIVTEIVQPFKSNSVSAQTMTVEISSDDNWERLLLGTSNGLKRVLLLPPSKQISLGPGFPKDRDVMLEIEVLEIQTAMETAQVSKVETSGKASIISRMAKMGQSILPKIPSSTPTDSEDTEDDASHTSPRHKKVEPLGIAFQKKNLLHESMEEVPRSVQKVLNSRSESITTGTGSPKPLVSASTFATQWSPTQMQPNYVTLDGQVYSLQPPTITPTIPTVMDPSLNMLLSETRMTNTELRMGMSKIADNVQKLLDKFHVLELQNAATPTSDKVAMDATLKMLLTMNTNQGATKDNELQKGTSVADSLTNNNLSEFNELRTRVTLLEKELTESRELQKNNTECIKNLSSEKETLVQANEDLHKKVQKLEALLKDASNEVEKIKTELEESMQLSNQYEKEKASMEDRISELLAERTVSENTASSSDEKDDDTKNREIKRIMNKTYQTLLEKFVDESYSTDYIKSMIANTIKNVTLRALYDKHDKVQEVVKATEVGTTTTNDLPYASPAVNNIVSDTLQQSELPKSSLTNIIPVVQDEPPPIPPIDPDVDNDWLQ